MISPCFDKITSFMVETEAGSIYYSEEDCANLDVAAMIINAIEAHGLSCTVTAFHDYGPSETDYDTLWTAPGYDAALAARFGTFPDEEASE